MRRAVGDTWELVWRDQTAHGAPVRSIAGFADAMGGVCTLEPATAGARLVILIEGTVNIDDGAQVSTGVRSFVAGPRQRPVVVEQPGPWRGIEVGLSLPAAATLIGMPFGVLGDAVIPLDVPRARLAAQLHERLGATTNWPDAFDAVDELVGPPHQPLVNKRVQWAWDTIEQTRGRTRIAAIAEHVGWSRRHLASSFEKAYGMTPKTAARLVRFERAHHMVCAGMPPAIVAGSCGYFDQAHMHRDFALFGAPTPGRVAASADPRGLRAAWPVEVTEFQDGRSASPYVARDADDETEHT